MKLTLSFPSKIRPDYLVGAALILFLVQLISGTDQVYAELIFLFLVLSGITVNLLGGFKSINGVVVAFMSAKFVLISQMVKVFMWEPGDRGLDVPVETAGILLTGMGGIFLAALLLSPIKFRKALLLTRVDSKSLRAMSIVLSSLGVTTMMGAILMGGGEEGGLRVGGVVGVLRQLTFTLGFAIGVGTAYTIVSSNGKRCFSMYNAIPFFTSFILGVLYASKQGMFEPFLYVAVACCAFNYTIQGKHLALFVIVVLLATFVLFPFGQTARNEVRGYGLKDTVVESARFIAKHFRSWEDFQDLLAEDAKGASEGEKFNYFFRSSGFLERVSLIKMVDLLAAATLNQGESGWETVTHGFKMMVPRFIDPAKPVWNTGQLLAHKVGMLSEEDESTQVSFGFIADSFSAFGWRGAAVIPFLLTVSFFLVYKYLVGPLDRNIWGIFFITQLQHLFTETTIASLILETLYRPFYYIFTYLLIQWIVRSGVVQTVFPERSKKARNSSDDLASVQIDSFAPAGQPPRVN